jgi:large subunit ribosomal protein L10
MTREEKNQVIDVLAEKINNTSHIYVTDTLGLNAGDTVDLRKECFKNEIELVVAKNTLLKKAIEKSDKDLSGLFEALTGPLQSCSLKQVVFLQNLLKSFARATINLF